MCDEPTIGAECVVDESSKSVGGQLPIMTMIVHTGLGCGNGNEPLVDVGRLGFIAFSGMTAGSNGWTPVAAKAALTVSSVNEECVPKYIHKVTLRDFAHM